MGNVIAQPGFLWTNISQHPPYLSSLLGCSLPSKYVKIKTIIIALPGVSELLREAPLPVNLSLD